MKIPEGSEVEPIDDFLGRMFDRVREVIEQHMTHSSGVSEGENNPHPGSHHFSVSKWQEANPDGDVEKMKQEAEQAGFTVVP